MGIVHTISLAARNVFNFAAARLLLHWIDPDRSLKINPASSGWDRESMRICWRLLDQTSRSFSTICKQVEGDLAITICLFYLVLRGLDTIEDDMTLSEERKAELLINFHNFLDIPGWAFHDSGPEEEDRELLVRFGTVIEEFTRLHVDHRAIIVDITTRMGAGMASFSIMTKIKRWEDYDLYCHYVAGVVGEGLSRLFSVSNKEDSGIKDELTLSNHMGLFLQKTNIIRDYAEDSKKHRFFWPEECWSSHDFATQEEIGDFDTVMKTEFGHQKRALRTLSSMLLDAVTHAKKSIKYLSLLQDPSLFRFCSIPQVMAMATLTKVSGNVQVFKGKVKVEKTTAMGIISGIHDIEDVCRFYMSYLGELRRVVTPCDPLSSEWHDTLAELEVVCKEAISTKALGRLAGEENLADKRMTQVMKRGRDIIMKSQ